MKFEIGRDKVLLLEQDESEEVIVLTNPIGNEKYGFLHWEYKEHFDNKEQALTVIKNTQKEYGEVL